MKAIKYLFIVFFFFSTATCIAQSQEDFTGQWERTSNILAGMRSNYPALLYIKKNGWFVLTEEGTLLFPNQTFIHSGEWEVIETGELKLTSDDPDVIRFIKKYECYKLSDDKTEISFIYFESPEGKINYAEDMETVIKYKKVE